MLITYVELISINCMQVSLDSKQYYLETILINEIIL